MVKKWYSLKNWFSKKESIKTFPILLQDFTDSQLEELKKYKQTIVINEHNVSFLIRLKKKKTFEELSPENVDIFEIPDTIFCNYSALYLS